MHGSIKESYSCTNINCGFQRDNFPRKNFRNEEQMEGIIKDMIRHPKFKKCKKVGCEKLIKHNIEIDIFPNGI